MIRYWNGNRRVEIRQDEEDIDELLMLKIQRGR